MRAPTCPVCDYTGSKSRYIGGDLDCTACDAAEKRMALREHMRQYAAWPDQDNVAWCAYQFALKLQGEMAVASAVPHEPQQEPVAYLRFRAAQQWSGVGGHDVEHAEWLETCQQHEIGDDKVPAFPVYMAPVPAVSVAPTGEVTNSHEKFCEYWRKQDLSPSLYGDRFALNGFGEFLYLETRLAWKAWQAGIAETKE